MTTKVLRFGPARAHVPFLATLPVAFLFLLAIAVRIEPAWGVEAAVLTWVQSWSGIGLPSFLKLVSVVTDIGSRYVVVPGAIAAMVAAGRSRSALAFAAAIGIVTVAALSGHSLLNEIAGRVRPLPGSAELSFPSGHTYGTTLFLGAMVFLVLRHRVRPLFAVPALAVLGTLIVSVGPSRMFLNMHWPADVVAGYVYGLLLLASLIFLYIQFEKFSWSGLLSGLFGDRKDRTPGRLPGMNPEAIPVPEDSRIRRNPRRKLRVDGADLAP
ncbi:MAG: phosphatase PAP2 family protein [Dehalococcoidia bacterium]